MVRVATLAWILLLVSACTGTTFSGQTGKGLGPPRSKSNNSSKSNPNPKPSASNPGSDTNTSSNAGKISAGSKIGGGGQSSGNNPPAGNAEVNVDEQGAACLPELVPVHVMIAL